MHLRPADAAPRCPSCNELANAARPADDANAALPKDGDISLCVGCGALSQWADGQTRLVPFDESALDAEDRTQIAAARRALSRVMEWS